MRVGAKRVHRENISFFALENGEKVINLGVDRTIRLHRSLKQKHQKFIIQDSTNLTNKPRKQLLEKYTVAIGAKKRVDFPEHFHLEQPTTGRTAAAHSGHRFFWTLHDVLRVLPQTRRVPRVGSSGRCDDGPTGRCPGFGTPPFWSFANPLTCPRLLSVNTTIKHLLALPIPLHER